MKIDENSEMLRRYALSLLQEGKKAAKKTVITEDHEKYNHYVLDMTVGRLLELLKADDVFDSLYRELEQFLTDTVWDGRTEDEVQRDYDATFDADPDYNEDQFHFDADGNDLRADR